jgi:hypothetical protein
VWKTGCNESFAVWEKKKKGIGVISELLMGVN